MSNTDTLVMLIVAGLFLCGAIIIGVASIRFKDKKTVKELWHLYAVEFALVSIVLVPIYIGGMVLLLATLALTLRGLWELYRVYDKPGFGTIQWASYIGATLALSIVFFSNELAISAALLTAMFIIFITSLLPSAKNGPMPIAFTGLALPLLPLLVLLTLASTPQGFLFLFFVYLVVELNDSFAYLMGKIFGKHRPFPYLSPRKSTEGLIGGIVIAGIIGTVLGVFLLELTLLIAVGATIVILLGGLLGDFATSALKRERGVKDFPPIHGFHGGALDIHDAYLFAVPGFYLYYWAVIQ